MNTKSQKQETAPRLPEVAHTPGPWKSRGRIIELSPRHQIAECYGPTNEFLCATVMANARLIAAAPQLLEALQIMVEYAHSPDFDGAPSNAALKRSEYAIAAATGESK